MYMLVSRKIIVPRSLGNGINIFAVKYLWPGRVLLIYNRDGFKCL